MVTRAKESSKDVIFYSIMGFDSDGCFVGTGFFETGDEARAEAEDLDILLETSRLLVVKTKEPVETPLKKIIVEMK